VISDILLEGMNVNEDLDVLREDLESEIGG
jgi:hypothetical protein